MLLSLLACSSSPAPSAAAVPTAPVPAKAAVPVVADAPAAVLAPTRTLQVEGICEASGAVWKDGAFILADDDVQDHLFQFDPAGVSSERGAAVSGLQFARGEKAREMNDLEGLALDEGGRLWATTSGSHNSSGELKPKRTRLAAWGGSDVLLQMREEGAGPAGFEAATSSLKLAGDWPRAFNVEGLAVTGNGAEARVYLGLRSPEAPNARAIIARGTAKAALTIEQAWAVDLGGRVVRDLLADAGSFLVLAGPSADETSGGDAFALYRWQPGNGAKLLGALPSNPDRAPEAIALRPVDGKSELWVFTDEGDRIKADLVKKGTCNSVKDCKFECDTLDPALRHVTARVFELPG